jgi:hypothetical protein
MNEISSELAARIKGAFIAQAAREKARERDEQDARIACERDSRIARERDEQAKRERHAEMMAATVAHFRAQS